jgi:hypothetical protein
MIHLALTAYGVPIPKAFADRQAALAWAHEEGHNWPRCRVVRVTAAGQRTTIWRHDPEPQGATTAAPGEARAA